MLVQGKVKKGLGDAKFWVNKINQVFYNKTDMKLFPGTLNIELNEPFALKNYWIIEKHEYGGTQDVYVIECKLFEDKAYVLRATQTQHKTNILEIVSNVNFREKYHLKDNDTVSIKF